MIQDKMIGEKILREIQTSYTRLFVSPPIKTVEIETNSPEDSGVIQSSIDLLSGLRKPSLNKNIKH